MKHHFITFTLSIIATLFCLPILAVRRLTTDQEITNLLKNPTFQNQFDGWTLTQQGGSITVQESAEGAIEVQSEGCEFVLEQTITDLPDGVYELQFDGYFATEAMPKSMLHGSMFCLNDMKNVIISSYEYTEEDPTNRVMAMPQDGKLTIRIIGRRMASSTDLTVFRNLHLYYRGQDTNEAHNACTSLLIDMQSSLITMWECKGTDITDYIQHPSCNALLIKNVGNEAYSGTMPAKFLPHFSYLGNLMEEVCNSRAAYIKLMNNVLQTENTANILIDNNLLTEQQYDAAKQLLMTATQGYTDGSLTNQDIENKLKDMASLSGFPKFIDNCMQISSPTDLCSFSVLVNEGMRTLDAQLTKDIDMKSIKNFQPAGLYSNTNKELADFHTNSYGGRFDGQGFQILNLNMQTAYEGGLFGRCYRAQISNVGLVNVSVTGTDAQTCGALAGTLMQTQVDNCYVAGNIQVVTDAKMATQFVGEGAWNTIFNNCYTLGDDFTNSTAAELNNCYWGNVATVAAESGELCFNLNNGETTDPIYFQTLEKDSYPILKSDHEIVRRTEEGNYYNGDDPDAINTIENSEPSTLNSQLYDLSGRRLSRKPLTGLYIHGNKVRR